MVVSIGRDPTISYAVHIVVVDRATVGRDHDGGEIDLLADPQIGLHADLPKVIVVNMAVRAAGIYINRDATNASEIRIGDFIVSALVFDTVVVLPKKGAIIDDIVARSRIREIDPGRTLHAKVEVLDFNIANVIVELHTRAHGGRLTGHRRW